MHIEKEMQDALLLLDFPSQSPPKLTTHQSPKLMPATTVKPMPSLEIDHNPLDLFAANLLFNGQSSISNSPKRSPATSPTSSDQEDKLSKKRKLKTFKKQENIDRTCDFCQATSTPMWRHGPPGYSDLCNKVSHSALLLCATV